MKRFFAFLLACALLCALAAPALADVAYMPRDRFFEKHWEECRYEGRWYYANGAAGYVLAHKTPDSAEATPLPNGGKYYISGIYEDVWGVLEYNKDSLENDLSNGSVSGWVDMREMLADYDSDAFWADHAAELKDANTALEWNEQKTVFCYKYPGSGEVTTTLEPGWFGGEAPEFSALFTDPAGRQWGYCSYYFGSRALWVCIDDPYNDALAPDENCVTITTVPAATPAPAPDPTAAPTETPAETPVPAPSEAPAGKTVELTPPADKETLEQAAKDNRGAGPYIAAGAAAVVIVAAAVLVATLRKKKQ